MDTTKKTCTACRQEKAIEGFYKSSGSKDGHDYYCKECRLENNRRFKRNNPEKAKEYTAKKIEGQKKRNAVRKAERQAIVLAERERVRATITQKTCNKCDETKLIDEFYQHVSMYDGYLNQCKVCANAHARTYVRPDDLGPVKPNKEVPGYFQAHKRVRAAKGGPASDFACVTCGEPAAHWAMKHTAEQVVTQLCRGKYLMSYSLNTDDYEPKCVRDHLVADAVHRMTVVTDA